jgi:cytochrome b subunit of formate dehydrogenase
MARHEQIRDGQVVRFCLLHRILHWPVMLGFAGLGITGFALYFSDAAYGRAVAWLVGGPTHLAWLHRACAVVTYAAVLIHILWLAYYKLVLKGRLTGPDSMFPSRKDLADLIQHIRYFFARGGPPAFERFSYLEKIDYYAVLIGMHTMGATGLILWFPEFFTRFLPGWFVNLALVLHLYEAIIAVAIKFGIHIYSVHLRPPLWPGQKTIFTGLMPLEELEREHAAQYRRLTQGGQEGAAS